MKEMEKITLTIEKKVDENRHSTSFGELFYIISAQGKTVKYLASQWALPLAVFEFMVHVAW